MELPFMTFFCPEKFFDRSLSNEGREMLILCYSVLNKSGEAFALVREIAKLTGLDYEQIRHGLQDVENLGLIEFDWRVDLVGMSAVESVLIKYNLTEMFGGDNDGNA